jgi:hypothetical protein
MFGDCPECGDLKKVQHAGSWQKNEKKIIPIAWDQWMTSIYQDGRTVSAVTKGTDAECVSKLSALIF